MTTAGVGADKKVSVGTLTAMVVGSIVGSGVFVLPRRFGAETGVLGAMIAWAIAGSGRVVTIAKMVPIAVFIVVGLVMFNGGIFTGNFWGGSEHSFSAVFEQAKGTMLITVFVFLGIEGASVYSRYARKRSDIGRATVLGFLSVLSVFMLVTLVSYGALPQAELSDATPPSMATVFESLVGNWGEIFIKIGVVISVLGAYLAWTLMACEVLYVPATTGDMPGFLTKVNAKGTPSAALYMVSIYVQLMLILLLFVSNALDFILDLTAALAVIPYLLATGYALKLTVRRETYDRDERSLRTDKVIAILACVYTAFLVYAAGPKHLLLSCLLYAPATLLYARSRRERGLRVFAPPELALFGIIVVGAAVAIQLLATGSIQL